MSKSVIQQAREALSHLESEAHSLGMRSEYRHDLARQIRAGLEQAARAGGEQAPIVWINPANIRRTMIASPGETVEVSAYREGEFTAPLYTHPPAKVPEYRTARDFYESDDFLLAQDIDACEQQAEGWNKCRQAMLACPPAKVPEWVKPANDLPPENGRNPVWYWDSYQGLMLIQEHEAHRRLIRSKAHSPHWMPTGLKRPTPPQQEGNQ